MSSISRKPNTYAKIAALLGAMVGSVPAVAHNEVPAVSADDYGQKAREREAEKAPSHERVRHAFSHLEARNPSPRVETEGQDGEFAGRLSIDEKVHLAVDGRNEISYREREAQTKGANPQTLNLGVGVEPQRGVRISAHGMVQQDDANYSLGVRARLSLDF